VDKQLKKDMRNSMDKENDTSTFDVVMEKFNKQAKRITTQTHTQQASDRIVATMNDLLTGMLCTNHAQRPDLTNIIATLQELANMAIN